MFRYLKHLENKDKEDKEKEIKKNEPVIDPETRYKFKNLNKGKGLNQ